LARRKLKLLEQQAEQSGPQFDLFSEAETDESITHPVIEHMASLEVDDLSPKQALDKLYLLKQLLDEHNPDQ